MRRPPLHPPLHTTSCGLSPHSPLTVHPSLHLNYARSKMSTDATLEMQPRQLTPDDMRKALRPPLLGSPTGNGQWWQIASANQEMNDRPISYPRDCSSMKLKDSYAQWRTPSPTSSPEFKFIFDGYMALKVPFYLGTARESIWDLIHVEGTELCASYSSPTKSLVAGYPQVPRGVSLWLLVHASHPDAKVFIDGFSHLMGSHEGSAQPLQSCIRGSIACGKDADEVARHYNFLPIWREQKGAVLIMAWAGGTPQGGASDWQTVIIPLDSNTIMLKPPERNVQPPLPHSALMRKERGDWADAYKYDNVAELFQSLLVWHSDKTNAPMPKKLMAKLLPQPPNAFECVLQSSSRTFFSLLEAPSELTWSARGWDNLVVTPYWMRATATFPEITKRANELNDASKGHFDLAARAKWAADNLEYQSATPVIVLADKRYVQVPSTIMVEKDGKPTHVKNPEHDNQRLERFLLRHWHLCLPNGDSQDDGTDLSNEWVLNVTLATLSSRQLVMNPYISLYGNYGRPGEPFHSHNSRGAVLVQLQYILVPADTAFTTTCLQTCDVQTFAVGPHFTKGARHVERTSLQLIKQLTEFARHVAERPQEQLTYAENKSKAQPLSVHSTEGSAQAPMEVVDQASSHVNGAFANEFDEFNLNNYGSMVAVGGEGATSSAQAPSAQIGPYSNTTDDFLCSHHLLGIGLSSSRITIGDASLYAETNSNAVSPGVRLLLLSMMRLEGKPNVSLAEAIHNVANFVMASQDANINKSELDRLRKLQNLMND